MQRENAKDTLSWNDKDAELDARAELDHQDRERQAELVARCLKGDEQAFAQIMDLYGNLLLRTVYLIARDEEAAKDITQETFILAWKSMHKLREPQFLRAWLLKIAVNQAVSFKRQLARKANFLREQFTQYTINVSIHEADVQQGKIEETLDIAQIIGQLPLNQRAVLVFFYYHKMTMPEIAETLGVAENTLRKRLQAALSKLRRVLQAEPLSAQDTVLKSDGLHSQISIHRGEA